MKAQLFLFSMMLILIMGCTEGHFENKKELHKKFKQLVDYKNLTYGLKTSYTNGVKYRYITINFEIGSNFLDSDRAKKDLSKKIALLAFMYFKPKDDEVYDGFVVSFKQKDGLSTIRKTNHQYEFDDLNVNS